MTGFDDGHGAWGPGGTEPYSPTPGGPQGPAYPGYPPPYPAVPQPYPGAGYPAPPPMGMYPPAPRTNNMATASLVCSLLGLLCVIPTFLGVIFGHIALSQIKRTGEDGKGLAIAGLIIGYVLLALFVIGILIYVGLVGAFVLSTPHSFSNSL